MCSMRMVYTIQGGISRAQPNTYGNQVSLRSNRLDNIYDKRYQKTITIRQYGHGKRIQSYKTQQFVASSSKLIFFKYRFTQLSFFELYYVRVTTCPKKILNQVATSLHVCQLVVFLEGVYCIAYITGTVQSKIFIYSLTQRLLCKYKRKRFVFMTKLVLGPYNANAVPLGIFAFCIFTRKSLSLIVRPLS